MNELKGKIALVTGSSRGIGAAIVKYLAGQGATVIINYSSSQVEAEALAATIVSEGGSALVVRANVSRIDEVQRLFVTIKKSFGRLDILVNNSGIYAVSPLSNVSEANFYRNFELSVLGLMMCSREAIRLFGDEGGSVVNLGPMATDVGSATLTGYTASGGAVDAVTRTLANASGSRNVSINAITQCPVESFGNDARHFAESATHSDRTGIWQGVAFAVGFLVSEKGRLLNGETLGVGASSKIEFDILV